MLCFERVRLGIESSISLILAKVSPIASWLKLQAFTARKPGICRRFLDGAKHHGSPEHPRNRPISALGVPVHQQLLAKDRRTKVLPDLHQILMVELKDDLEGISGGGENVRGCGLADYLGSLVGAKLHIPDGLHQHVLGIQGGSFYGIDARRQQTRRLHEVLSSRQELNKILFFHGLNTLWVPEHESVRVELHDRWDLEIMVRVLVAAKELFDGNGGHVFIEARNWAESELTSAIRGISIYEINFYFPRSRRAELRAVRCFTVPRIYDTAAF